ncbi:dihydrofolate reductase family protein [Pseudoxanthomonas winnipegensis]|jgi:dihydrofolate reductase|uniref:Dihydrofolate reductase n=1 Tax=Pseudoxanthomonas winnipegensis TaxID=2480810 RepID=A0A4V2HCZ0_9GAMM|nr:dihydrofolate reductase family protein [Pseudoxanthomonas winnipegensis]TAA24633.1 dihydrofolate reductase [Pseudoxanthomonas winnipegensis]
MRALKVVMAMSLDGFVSDIEGSNGWMFTGDQAAMAWKVDAVSNAGLHIMGSRTFRAMAGFWPTAISPFAAPMNRIPKAVFTRQGPAILQAAPAANAPQTSATEAQVAALQPGGESWAEAYVAGGDLADEVARLKADDGPPIVAHGGAAFVRSLIARNLVDEYALLVYPLALGQGLPIFSELTGKRHLALVDTTAFPSGAVAQTYRAM